MTFQNGKVGLPNLIELENLNKIHIGTAIETHFCKPCHDNWSLIIQLIDIGQWKDFRTHPYKPDCNCVGCSSIRMEITELLDIYWNKGWIDVKEKDGKLMIGKGINFDQMIKAS